MTDARLDDASSIVVDVRAAAAAVGSSAKKVICERRVSACVLELDEKQLAVRKFLNFAQKQS